MAGRAVRARVERLSSLSTELTRSEQLLSEQRDATQRKNLEPDEAKRRVREAQAALALVT